jgi:uncharacterized protein
MTDGPLRSTASVPTERPARYGKQLVSHLTRRSGSGAWDEDGGTGWIEFTASRLTLVSADGSLDMELTTPAEDADRMEDVVGRHLVRFGTRDELVVRWIRSDGTDGSVQRVPADQA